MMLENPAESLNMDLQLRQYQISKNDDEYMHEKPHEYNRPLDYQMEKINQGFTNNLGAPRTMFAVNIRYESHGNFMGVFGADEERTGPENYLFVWRPDLAKPSSIVSSEAPLPDWLDYYRSKYGYIDAPESEGMCLAVRDRTPILDELDDMALAL